MAKKKIPTVEELREYLRKEDEYRKDCIENNKTYRPPFEDKYWILKFDSTAYYYCIALISLSDYRHEDCEKLLWELINIHSENDEDMIGVLLRNMKMLESTRTFLTPMKERLEEVINN